MIEGDQRQDVLSTLTERFFRANARAGFDAAVLQALRGPSVEELLLSAQLRPP